MDLSKYYELICREPMIDRHTEYDLFMTYYDDGVSDEEKRLIKEQIIKANLRFCFKQAKYFSKNDPNIFEELILAANEGLVVGFEKYKPSTEVRFLSYAGHWVKQRILKTMSQMRIVSLPIWKQQLSSRIVQYMEKNEGFTFDDLKKDFPEVSEKDLRELSETKFLTFYIEDMTHTSPEFEIDPIGSDVEAKIDNERLNSIVGNLPPLQKNVLSMLFGLGGETENSHAEICKRLQISKEQLREQRRLAFETLKDLLADHVA